MPDALTFLVLVLAAYRLTRLAGWDDFPLAAKIRAWVIGERWVPREPSLLDVGGYIVPLNYPPILSAQTGDEADAPSLPGKQPSSEVENVRPAYDRPTLAHLIHCPFCVGFWISLATWVAWLAWHPVLYGLAPFAISGAVGLVAKNLDP